MPLNVAIFGSCVSRDAVGLVPEDLTPAHYTARQAWVSAASPRMWIPPIDRLNSPFQRRMLEGDFRSTLFAEIAAHAPGADIVLLDIVDDRFGVIEMLPGRYATLSAELSGSGFLLGDRLLRRRRLMLGDPEHLRRFRTAAELVKRALIEAGAWERTILIRAPYATESVEGDSLVGDYATGSDVWNERYAEYYTALEELGFRMISPASDLVYSTRTHQWGPHPIHYQEAASRDIVAQVLKHYRDAGGESADRGV
ncbi:MULTISPECIES: DUF6270 domain-containing protein [unclassified Leucobacter]|uniref:DUF6270 domain-containing protein n=1 Tax=unclassified Leucobacter TaxID=2621730 RepID=UPI0006214940|nr:DUF6270 domain-containing protein [Leucobacter sp. Ag1]KKI19819.1 hypothetical protein XM48_08935 [Leucobacter sp. Ag1]